MMENLFEPNQPPTAIDPVEAERIAQEMEQQRLQMEQAKADEEKRIIQKLTQRFRTSQTGRSAKEKIWQILDMFDRGEQWKDKNIPAWIPKPVMNFIRHYRILKRANLATGIPRATLEPTDPVDEPIIEKLQKAYDHVWVTEKVERTVRRCIDRAVHNGTAIAMVYTDDTYIGGKFYPPEPVMVQPNQPMIGPDGQPIMRSNPNNKLYQGRICVKRIPIENFFPDFDAYRLEDMKWCEFTEIVPFSTVRNNQAFRQYAGDKLLNLKAPRPSGDPEGSGEIYDRDNKITESSAPIDESDEVVTLHTHFQRYVTESGEWRMDVIYYLENTDFILLRVDDVKPNEFPFAVLYDEEEEKDFYGTSLPMTGLLEMQKVVNKVQQVASVIGALHQNPQKVVLRESGINAQKLAKAGNVPGHVWASNIPNPIEVINPPQIPRGLFELDNQMKADMRDMAGMNEAYMGNAVGSLTTSTGVDSLIERATIRDRDKMVQIDEFVERITHLIVLNIIHKWEDERPIAVPQPNGNTQFETWEPIDPITANNLSWRVKSNVYAKSPITQASRRQQADKLLQMQGQFQFQPPVITPEEWVKSQELDDGPEILRRMEADRIRMEQQQQMAASGMLHQQIMLMAQGIATGQLPPEQMQQMVEQLVQVASQPALAMGQPPGAEGQQQPSAPAQPSLPQGATSEVSMANMASGGI